MLTEASGLGSTKLARGLSRLWTIEVLGRIILAEMLDDCPEGNRES